MSAVTECYGHFRSRSVKVSQCLCWVHLLDENKIKFNPQSHFQLKAVVSAGEIWGEGLGGLKTTRYFISFPKKKNVTVANSELIYFLTEPSLNETI